MNRIFIASCAFVLMAGAAAAIANPGVASRRTQPEPQTLRSSLQRVQSGPLSESALTLNGHLDERASLGTVSSLASRAAASVADSPLLDTYYGYGKSYFDGTRQWVTTTQFSNDTVRFSDLFDWDALEGWGVYGLYDASARTITLPTHQRVAVSVSSQTADTTFIFFNVLDAEASNEVDAYVISIQDDGSLSGSDNYLILQGCATRQWTETTGFYQLFEPGIVWTTQYVLREPEASCAPDNTVLNYYLTSFYYGGGAQYGLMAADADVTFRNCTPTGTYSSLSWSMPVYEYDSQTSSTKVVDYESAQGETFSIHTGVGTYYGYPVLTATNDAGSSTDTLCSQSLDAGMLVASGSAGFFMSSDNYDTYGRPMLMRATYDKGWGIWTDLNGKSATGYGISSLYCYQGKPGNPFYFEGVDLVGYNYSTTDASATLTLNVRACQRSYDADLGYYTLSVGDVLYTSTVTVANAFVPTNADYGYGYIHFGEFAEAADGLSYGVDYCQVDQEFCLEYTWTSGAGFHFTPFCESDYTDYTPGNTFFSCATGSYADAGVLSFSSTGANVWSFYEEPVFGYLYTEDETTLRLAGDGSAAVLSIRPFECATDADGNAVTALWLGDGSDDVTLLWDDVDSQLDSWLSASIVSESYTSDDWGFQLRIQAEPLPEGQSERTGHIVFEQWGAKLVLEVVQSASTPADGSYQALPRRLSLAQGWNWVSFGQKADAAITTLLSGSSWTAGDEVKSATSLSVYSSKMSAWTGPLATLSAASMYKVRTASAHKCALQDQATGSDVTVTVHPKWNYLPFLSTVSMSVSDALSGYAAAEGDQIKSQDALATFSNGAWTGSLTALQPNVGYMLYSHRTDNVTFTYPTAAQAAQLPAFAAQQPALVSVHRYAGNASIIGTSASLVLLPGDVVSAYVGDELRGATRVQADGQFYLVVDGDSRADVRLVVGRDGEVLGVADQLLQCRVDGMLGTSAEATAIRFVPSDDAEASSSADAVQLYDMLGRRVRRAASGLYVRNGRKVSF